MPGIEQPHDFAVDADCPRNPDELAEGLGDSLGDAGLAVTRRAVQEQAAAGVDRRTEADQHCLVDQQVFERAVQIFFGRVLVGERLLLDALMYACERHRRGAEVRAVLGELLGPLAAEFGELVDVVVRHRRAFVADEAVVLHRVEQRIDQPKRRASCARPGATGGFAAAVERLEDQGFDFAFSQAGGGDAVRLYRHPPFVLGAIALRGRLRGGAGLGCIAGERPARSARGLGRGRSTVVSCWMRFNRRIQTTVVVGVFGDCGLPAEAARFEVSELSVMLVTSPGRK